MFRFHYNSANLALQTCPLVEVDQHLLTLQSENHFPFGKDKQDRWKKGVFGIQVTARALLPSRANNLISFTFFYLSLCFSLSSRFIFSQFWRLKSKIKTAGLVSFEASFPGLQMTALFLLVHMVFPLQYKCPLPSQICCNMAPP